ncbi:Outer membrane receptor proteins, mostly Fe transport [Alkalitalea saponilacus]|uniref:Outer membrane receptor proteins, mostly Fe transport n=2 Tax=Alkalitalea saponilacus TaxID=889453 RepID=A0A1T5H8G0_9BACT|nr:Outer membrane receptor proteins, mostly Fe transport [Alkalitalea saponilacus]
MLRMRRKGFCLIIFTIIFILITLASPITAQTVSPVELSGHVADQNEEPIINAHIRIVSTNAGAVTDVNGRFTISTTPSFPLEISISAIGFQSKTINLASLPSDPIRITLEEDRQMLQQIEVTANRLSGYHSQRIEPIHVRMLPSAAGASIEGLVRSQMGVASNNELSSQYRVRGGNFDENLVYVNGQEVHRPFLMHSGQQEGLSFVNPDLVESVEFSAGGFSASYGDKMSSVLDIRYKRPTETAGSVSAGMLGANAHLEGAAFNQKVSWITGVRYKTNRYLLGTLDEKGDYKPNFTDAQAFLTYEATPRLSFEVLGYYSLNTYEFIPQTRETTFGTISDVKRLRIYFAGKEENRFETGYGALSTIFNVSDRQQYKLTFTGFRTFEEETYDIAGAYWLQEIDNPFDADDEGTQIGVGEYLQHARNDLFANVISANLEGNHSSTGSITSWGIQVRQESFRDRVNEWELIDSAGYSIPYRGDILELAYTKNANHDIVANRVSGFLKNQSSLAIGSGFLMVDAGIRASYYSFNDEYIISPRVLLNFLPSRNSNHRYRLSGGFYYQPPFFKEMRRPDGTLNKDIKAQKSIHVVSGFDYYFHKMERPFKFTTELYYKHMKNLIPYQVDNVRIIYSGENEAKGYAVGIDFKINGELVPGEESWATLSLMKTEEDLLNDRWINPATPGEPGYIPRPSDQRLNFSMFIQDHLPNNPDFKAHLSFFFGTGLPFGPPRSPRYMAVHRLPSYRRLDIGFSYDLLQSRLMQNNTLNLKNMWLGIEIFNLPNIDNTISHYWVTDINNRQYAVPNYLTSRRINLKLTATF